MRYLIEAANKYGLSQIAEQAASAPQIHGIVIDIDPFWMEVYRYHLNNPGRSDDIRPAFRNFVYFPAVVPMDLDWRATFMNDWGNYSNLLVRILLRPGSSPVEFKYEGPLRIVQEHQPVPRLAAHGIPQFRPLEGGLSLGSGTTSPGTLGGILTDSVGKQYGLSCSHVVPISTVDQPAAADHRSAASIGQVVFRIDPVSSLPGVLCNVYNQPVNEMDLALIELSAGITGKASEYCIGKVDGYIPNRSLHPNLVVEFHGRTSGHKTGLVLGGTGLVNEVEDMDGNVHCFGNLVEIKEPTMGGLVISRPVKGGDSGSWVMGQGAMGTEWCGMVIGENRQSGYIITAESILDTLRANSYSLSCT